MIYSQANTTIRNGWMLSASLAAVLGIGSWLLGKNNFFLWLNGNGGKAADFFFQYITHLGDGAIFVPLLLWVIWKKSNYWKLVVLSAIISSLITQGAKQFFFHGAPRPTKAITDAFIHQVAGVEVHQINSFPSGHTATAFAVYLILLILYPTRKFLFAGIIIATLVAYSRVYLAQHFPIDLAAGIGAAIISVTLADYLLQKKSPVI